MNMNLMAIHGAGIRKMRNENGDEVEVICLPVKENFIFLTEKGAAYLPLVAFPIPEEKRIEKYGYRSLFLVKQEIPKEENPEWKENVPILGSLRERILRAEDINQGSKYYEMNEKSTPAPQPQKQAAAEQSRPISGMPDANTDLPF